MHEVNNGDSRLREASNLIKSALEILDESDAPGQIGAYLDHAVNLLQDELSRKADSIGKSVAA